MSTKLTLATVVLGLLLVGCGDDEEGTVDAGGRDAGGSDSGATDAGTADGGAVDAGTGDAGTGDAGTADAGPRDAAADAAGGAFSSTLDLTTEDEVPVCAAAGASAMGAGTITIDATNTTVEVMITFSGLSGAATAGHIHMGADGVAGPAVLPFTDLTSPIMETFTAADYPSPPPAGAPATFAAFLEAMRAGETYVNIHTAACGPGEIRDQIE